MKSEIKDTEFYTWDENVEVTGATILSLVDAMGEYQAIGLAYLKRCGIDDLERKEWYSYKSYMNALRLIYEKVGESTLYLIGTRIPKNAVWSPDIETLEQALDTLDIAYQENHRGGDIGYFKFTKTDKDKGVMECKKTYGTPVDKGVIVALTRIFDPAEFSYNTTSVELDESKPNRRTGADTNYFLIHW